MEHICSGQEIQLASCSNWSKLFWYQKVSARFFTRCLAWYWGFLKRTDENDVRNCAVEKIGVSSISNSERVCTLWLLADAVKKSYCTWMEEEEPGLPRKV